MITKILDHVYNMQVATKVWDLMEVAISTILSKVLENYSNRTVIELSGNSKTN